MKPINIFCFILVLLQWHQVFADVVESTFQSLNSPHLKVWTREETLQLESKTFFLRKLGLTWLPDYTSQDTPDTCQLTSFQQSLQNSSKPEAVLQDFWKNCEPWWRKNSYNALTQSLEVLRTDFEPTQHPAVRVIQWQLPNDLKIRGLLFFKGPKPRPLVILRPGIFSHLKGTVAERFLMMQLFEEGPFHVLMLPSTSGSDYIQDNLEFTFGGFDEGLQTWHILNYLTDQKEPIHQYITNIHLVGISLGAHGLWLTHLIDQTLKQNRIGKVFLYCPAIHLEQTFNSQQQNQLTDFFVYRWFDLRLSPLRQQLGLNDRETVDRYLQRQLKNYQKPRVPWPQTLSPLPATQNPYWTFNNYWDWMPKYDYTKTFVIWNAVDPVVPPSLNADLLLKDPEVAENSLLRLPRGFHCSLPSSYQWPFLSLSLRGYLEPGLLAAEAPIWEKRFQLPSRIREVTLRKVTAQRKHLKVEAVIRFKNFFLPPRVENLEVPFSVSDQAWVIDELNETLQESLLRELTRRMSWDQDGDQWRLSFAGPQRL